MRAPLPAIALLVLATLSATTTFGAPPAAPTTRTFEWDVVALPCAGESAPEDGVCLGYAGQVPGPTLDVNLGDTMVVTLRNRIAQTLPASADAALGASAVSFHVHGTAISAAQDGVMAHEGTQLVESVAHPDGSFTYAFRAAFVGAWHYHDHVMGADGSEGTKRGLFGSLVVRNGAERRPDVVVDLHAHDAGVNLGFPVGPSPTAGDDVEVSVVVLGSYVWTLALLEPDGDVAWERTMGPGESFRVPYVAQAQPHAWRARFAVFEHSGVIG